MGHRARFIYFSLSESCMFAKVSMSLATDMIQTIYPADQRSVSRVFPGKTALKISLYTLLLVLILCTVMGSSTALSYNLWVFPDTNSSMGSYTLYPTINPYWDTATIILSGETIILRKGDCEATLTYRLCFLDTRFDVSQKWGRFDAATDTMIPELYITLVEIVPQFGFEQNSDKNQLFVEEETTVHITISFQGEMPIENITFRQEIPYSVTITDPGELRFTQGILMWERPAMAGEKSLTYKIKFNQPANVTLSANLTGMYPTGAKLSKLSNLELKTIPIPNPLTQTASLSTQQPSLGDTLTYTVTVANAESQENPVSKLLISVPDSVTVTKWDNRLQRVGSRFTWDGNVPGNGQQQFDISGQPEHSGMYSITAQLYNTFYDTLQSKYFSSTNSLASNFNVQLQQLAPSISFMLNKNQINSSEPSNIHVFISNPNPKTTLYDINATLETNLLGTRTRKLANLAPGQEIEMFYIPFIAPSLTEDTTLNVAFNGTYRTWYYESFSFKTTNTLLIKKDLHPIILPPAASNPAATQNQTAAQQTGTVNSTPASGEQAPSAPQSGSAPKENIFTKIFNWLKRYFSGK
jgi:hypothetical protein